MNLYEKLNRLDDSLVESKRVIKKKKLTESSKDVNRRKKFLKDVFTKWEILDLAEAHNDFTGRTYAEAFDYVLNNWDNFYFEDEYEAFCEEELDDDIDEMLTEAELTPWEKIVKTFPDDFGHGSTRPTNKIPAQHKTMNDYARDPNTPTYDNKEVTTKPEMSARDKLLKTFPDLDIRLGESYLKEAVKDTDYVIAYVHPVSTFSKRYSFLGSNYRMTKDLNKAMTYTSKFSAEDEIKYAKDEVERIVDNSTSTGYASNFAADSDRFLVVTVAQARELLKNPDKKVSRAVSNNPEAQEAAKPVATEIHSIIKKYNVSLSSFLMLIKELIKAEDPEA